MNEILEEKINRLEELLFQINESISEGEINHLEIKFLVIKEIAEAKASLKFKTGNNDKVS